VQRTDDYAQVQLETVLKEHEADPNGSHAETQRGRNAGRSAARQRMRAAVLWTSMTQLNAIPMETWVSTLHRSPLGWH